MRSGTESLQTVVDTQARKERNALALQQQESEKQKNFDAMMFATSPEVFLECIDSLNLAKLDEAHAQRYNEKLKQFVPEQQDFPYTDQQYDILRAVFGNGRGGTDAIIPEMYSETVQAIYDRAMRTLNARYRPSAPRPPAGLKSATVREASSSV